MSEELVVTDSSRKAYTQGLREVADFLDAHPEVPLPYLDSYQTGPYVPTLPIYLVSSDDQKKVLVDVARAMGKATKRVRDDDYQVFRRFAGITLVAQASRDQVCERVVVGTHEEIVEEQDPEALAKVPVRAVTKVVEDVEWRCSPLLAAAQNDTEHDAEHEDEPAGAVA